MKTHYIYKKHDIFRNTEVGYKMKYNTRCMKTGDSLCADTLQGIKNLINLKEKA
jgi:hypothetical protein